MGNNVRYVEWVDDYTTVLLPNDVHVVPLFAGAGTKNRVVTALSYNCRVISTDIGLENTNYNSTDIFKVKKSHLDNVQIFIVGVERFIKSRDLTVGRNLLYFNKRMTEFRNDLVKYHLVDKSADY